MDACVADAGGNAYKSRHMAKAKLELEGRLPALERIPNALWPPRILDALPVDQDFLARLIHDAPRLLGEQQVTAVALFIWYRQVQYALRSSGVNVRAGATARTYTSSGSVSPKR
ncbi:hypothetical protein PI124_g1014 [Phytophthora idaei]|nr:hypothetical protein PI124_g1014 [Phytophthora idaei]